MNKLFLYAITLFTVSYAAGMNKPTYNAQATAKLRLLHSMQLSTYNALATRKIQDIAATWRIYGISMAPDPTGCYNDKKVAIIKECLRDGANPNVDLGYGVTLLKYAAQHGDDNTDLMGSILEHGASTELGDEGESALHITCTAGFYNKTELLLKYGANVNRKDRSCTPFLLALLRRHFTVTQLLLERGGHDIDNNDLILAEHIARERNYTEMLALIASYTRSHKG